ncbi:MAG: hypothetical protein H0X34_00200 [Chthoniobacterales bacterium]|nr:hypothetical protein [Chthoniobacterales bacterium]
MTFALQVAVNSASLEFEIRRILLSFVRPLFRARVDGLERIRGAIAKLEKIRQRRRMLEERFEDLFEGLLTLRCAIQSPLADAVRKAHEGQGGSAASLPIPAQLLCAALHHVAGRGYSFGERK